MSLNDRQKQRVCDDLAEGLSVSGIKKVQSLNCTKMWQLISQKYRSKGRSLCRIQFFVELGTYTQHYS